VAGIRHGNIENGLQQGLQCQAILAQTYTVLKICINWHTNMIICKAKPQTRYHNNRPHVYTK